MSRMGVHRDPRCPIPALIAGPTVWAFDDSLGRARVVAERERFDVYCALVLPPPFGGRELTQFFFACGAMLDYQVTGKWVW